MEIIYLVFINLIEFFIMYIDKYNSIKHKYRISEKTIFIIAIIGGSIGLILGMYFFHHKTKKLKFKMIIPLILIIQIIILNSII